MSQTNGLHSRVNLIRASSANTRERRRDFTQNHLRTRSADKTTHRERRVNDLTSRRVRRKRIGLPVFLSIIYYRLVKRSVFTGSDFEYTDEYTVRPDARTRSEPVPAWCRCNDVGTHSFLSVHRLLSFSRHLRSLWHETSAECASDVPSRCGLGRDGTGQARDSRDSRKFYSTFRATVANEIPRK